MYISVWDSEAEIGYTQQTTFWQDFSIADAFGINAIKDTYNRSFDNFKGDYVYLTELSMVTNRKCWEWYEKGDQGKSELYSDLYYRTRDYALDNLKGNALSYYIQTTD